MELLQSWGFVAIGISLVLVAFLVNQFAPARRRRIRHAVRLYFFYLAVAGIAYVLGRAKVDPLPSWSEHSWLVAHLLGALTVVHLVAMLVFDVILPTLGVAVASITTDLAVGLLYLFVVIGVLKAEHVSASSVVTTSAVVSGVLALSMQATLGNILGGVALQLDGSVHAGDWIQLADGTQGRVIAVRWRHTVVETRNWDTVIVPNSNLLAQNIVILGKRTDKPVQHRMWVYFNVDFRYSPTKVIEAVREALWAAPIEGVADDPKPSVICYDFAKDMRDSFAYYAVRYWLTDLPNDDPTNSRIRSRIYSALKRACIPLARPAQTLFVEQGEPPEQRDERHKEQRLHALEQVDLFQSLTREEREFAAMHLRHAPFTAGETITRQGAVAHWLYVLTSGSVEIRRHLEPGAPPKTVAEIEAPSFFGEMGLMTGEPRTADVVAMTDVECYRLDKEGLQKVLEERPDAAHQFSETLAKRRLDLSVALGDLDDAARKERMKNEQSDILDKIQVFFGLGRTTRS
jgi:CRP-like cAMP-binding protein/small-conductance mechanosensitive channel